MRRPTAAHIDTSLETIWPLSAGADAPDALARTLPRDWATGKRRCTYLYVQGWQHHERGDTDTALRAFQELLVRGRQTGHQGWISAAESAIAEISPSPMGHHPEAASRPALPLTGQCQLAADCQQAALLHLHGYWSEAILAYQQVLTAATQADQGVAIAGCLHGLGLIYLDQRRYDLAESHLRAAVLVLADQAAPVLSAIAYHNLGLVHYQQSQYRQAQTCFQTALQHWQTTTDCLGVALTLDYLGRVYAHQQDGWLALGSFEAAIDVLNDLAQQTDVRPAAAALLMQIADLCERTQHPELAIAYWRETLEICQTLPAVAPSIVICQRLSHLHQQAGQTAIARHYLQQCAIAPLP